MFTHLVILKIDPWFLYCANEADALNVCKKFKDNVSGIVIGDGLIVKQPRSSMTLEQEEIHQIEFNPESESIEKDDQMELDIEEVTKELEDEFTKLQLKAD